MHFILWLIICGIAGAIDLRGNPIPDLERRLEAMSSLIAHRGPDDAGIWTHDADFFGCGVPTWTTDTLLAYLDEESALP